jgi:hypothetical protein
VQPLAEDELFLLPPDIKGFNLGSKVCQECRRLRFPCPEDRCESWQLFDVGLLRDVEFNESAWSHLVLDRDTKVRALLPSSRNPRDAQGVVVLDRVARTGYAKLEHDRAHYIRRNQWQRRRAGMFHTFIADVVLAQRSLTDFCPSRPAGHGKDAYGRVGRRASPPTSVYDRLLGAIDASERPRAGPETHSECAETRLMS